MEKLSQIPSKEVDCGILHPAFAAWGKNHYLYLMDNDYKKMQELCSLREGSYVRSDGKVQKVQSIGDDSITLQDGRSVTYDKLEAVTFRPLDLSKDDIWKSLPGKRVFANADGGCYLITAATSEKVRIDQRWWYPELLMKAFLDEEGLPMGEAVTE